jgi:hypothetical protein
MTPRALLRSWNRSVVGRYNVCLVGGVQVN